MPEAPSQGGVSPQVAVQRHVWSLLRSGAVKPGERVPSERMLARELRVHRDTVRRAMATLDAEGLFRTHAKGHRVVKPDESFARNAVQSTIAVLMPDVSRHDGKLMHTQSGWAEVMGQGVLRALRGFGRSTMILPPQQVNESLFAQFRAAPPAGLIVADLATHHEALDRMTDLAADLPCPFVVYGGHPRWKLLDRVVTDHAVGSKTLYTHLWQRQRRRILFAMPQPNPQTQYWIEQRLAGYEQANQACGSDYRTVVELAPGHNPSWRADGFEDEVRRLLGHLAEHLVGPHRADAIMWPSDGGVFAVAAACRKLHLEPGRDIDIVGYDNYWRDAAERQFDPYQPPATVDKCNGRIGEQMVALLEDRLSGRVGPEPQVRNVPPLLVLTESP